MDKHSEMLIKVLAKSVKEQDLLIRNDIWLIETMLDPSVHAILYGFDHKGRPNSALHSDFYAFRPHALISQPHITEMFLEEHLANRKMTAEVGKRGPGRQPYRWSDSEFGKSS
jgi:hypothetical protein